MNTQLSAHLFSRISDTIASGNKSWGLNLARRYLQENDPLLKALERKAELEPKPQSQQARKRHSFCASLPELLARRSLERASISRRSL